MPESNDVLDRVAALAPDARSLADTEWPADDRRRLLANITGCAQPADGPASAAALPLTPYRSTSVRHHWARPIAAATATVTVTAGVLLAVRATDMGAGGAGVASAAKTPALARPFNPPSGLSTRVPGGRYYYHVDRVIDLDAQGKALPNGPDAELNRSWIDGDGNLVSVRAGSQYGCERFPRSALSPSFDEPTRAFFASLPTDVTGLTAYLRSHTTGSSSQDEAVFVAVGDSLLKYGGLASPRLRAAMLAVLSRTPGVHVFLGQLDYLRRSAIRVDFVDQRIRPGEIHSYYFNPTTFRFLEESTSRNGQASTYNHPTPGYRAPAPTSADDPEQLRRTLGVDVVIEEKMLQTLPAEATSCSGSLVQRTSTPIAPTPS
jgi:hypothetical protein